MPNILIVERIKPEAMKTKINFRLFVATLTLVAATVSIDTEAQNPEARKHHYQKKEKNERTVERRVYNDARNRDYDRHVYDVKDHRREYTYRYDRRFEYNHPKFGHVYRKFYTPPVRLKHAHGDFYFYGGNYYRYHHGVGYVRVELPRNMIFVDLPFRVERVYYGSRIYYRHGDMFFESCGHGYRPVPRIGIHFSAHL